MTRLSVFSFFSGAGFLDLGFEKAGYDVCYVNENHSSFLDAYKHSRQIMGLPEPKYGYESASIEGIDPLLLADRVATEIACKKTVGFIGGPPCPDFSIGGKNKGEHGKDGRLSKVYMDLICKHKPDFFLFENVAGLYSTKKHRAFLESIKCKAKEAGYHLHERLINSIQYGVPQDRGRIILLGFLDKRLPSQFVWAHQTYPGRAAFKYRWPDFEPFSADSVRRRGKDIPVELCVQFWFDKNDVTNHPNAQHCFQPRAGLAKFRTVAEGDDSKKSYKRLHRWRYSPTACYGNNEVHLHPYKERRITVAEALAIQSLPKEFELPSSMTLSDMFKTVGNGVPFLAAEGLAKSIKQHLKTTNASNRAKHREGYPSVAA